MIQEKFFLSRIPKLVWVLITIVILAGISFSIYSFIKNKNAESEKVEQRTDTVKRGDVALTLTGSGAVTPSIKEGVSSEVKGSLTKVNYKIGDEVKEGDILFEVDDSDARLEYEKLKNSLQQKLLSLSTVENQVNSLSVTSPFSGIVSEINVKLGESVSKGASIMTVTDRSQLKTVLQFNSQGVEEIKEGTSVIVFLENLMQSVTGKVTYISDTSFVGDNGGQLYNVEVQIDNAGLIREGMVATAQISTSKGISTSINSNKLTYNNSKVIKAEAGGEVTKLNVVDNQFVKAGEGLASFENDDIIVSKSSTELQVKELEMQIELALSALEDYKIKSPVNGIIVDMEDVNIGDEVKAGSVYATVVNTKGMEFDVSIDELDISDVQAGQNVNITIDALEATLNNPLPGQVSKIAIEGDYKNGVTTFPVTISLSGMEGLRGGMNANAEILVKESKDTLYVPLEAVTKVGDMSFVYVKGGTTSEAVGIGNAGVSSGQNNPAKPAGRAGNGFSGAGRNEDAGGAGRTGGFGANMSDEERQKMRAQFQSMSDEERQAMLEQRGLPQQGATSVNSDDYYAGGVRVAVKTGISNESYIEILGGISEGDTIILPKRTSSASSSSASQQGGFGGGSNMGGIGRMVGR